MKYVVIIIFLSALFVELSCVNRLEDEIFEYSFNERIDSLKNKYNRWLTRPEWGWKSKYSLPKQVTGVTHILFNFKHDSVIIKSDYRAGLFDDAIGYRLDQGWKVELVFESYSPIHALYELESFQSGGGFIFNFNPASTPDSLVLERRLNRREPAIEPKDRKKEITKNYLVLVPATQEEWTQIEAVAQVDKALSKVSDLFLSASRITTVSYNSFYKSITLGQLSSTSKEIKLPVELDKDGFTLLKPIKIGNVSLSRFSYRRSPPAFVSDDNNQILIK